MKKIFYCFLVLLLAVGFAAGNAMATSYDPSGDGGKYMLPPMTPMIWNHGNMGDALFGELYRGTTIDEVGNMSFVTFFTIENTSSYWVAAHVRLRSGRYSIEVKDFPILLSPKDVFWMQYQPVTEVVDGQTVLTDIILFSQDTKTLIYSGLNQGPAWNPDDGTWQMSLDNQLLKQFKKLTAGMTESELWLETTQGHIEVFGLFAVNPKLKAAITEGQNFYSLMGALYTNVKNNVNCTTSVTLQLPYNGGTDATFYDVGNYLSGQVYMGDFSSGIYMGYPMKAIQNFRAVCDAPVRHRDDDIRGFIAPAGMIVYLPKYEGDLAYTDPDWATSFGPTWNDGDDWIHTGHVAPSWEEKAVQSYSLDEVDDAISKSYLSGTYFNNTNNDTYTMLAVTFPTKYLHLFFDKKSGLKGDAGIDDYLKGISGAWPVGDPSSAVDVRDRLDVASYSRVVGINLGIWDFEEKPCGFNSSPFSTITFPWEVTLVPIGSASQAALESFCFLVLNDERTDCLDVDPINFKSGLWELFKIQFSGTDPRNLAQGATPDFCETSDYYFMRSSCSSMLSLQEEDSLPVSVQVMDFNFYDYPGDGYPHSRMLDPSWSNPIFKNY